jgi:hypothetical protein
MVCGYNICFIGGSSRTCVSTLDLCCNDPICGVFLSYLAMTCASKICGVFLCKKEGKGYEVFLILFGINVET